MNELSNELIISMPKYIFFLNNLRNKNKENNCIRILHEFIINEVTNKTINYTIHSSRYTLTYKNFEKISCLLKKKLVNNSC